MMTQRPKRMRQGRRERAAVVAAETEDAKQRSRAAEKLFAEARASGEISKTRARELLRDQATRFLQVNRRNQYPKISNYTAKIEAELAVAREALAAKRGRRTEPMSVYVAGAAADGFPVKIGMSSNVEKRVAELSTGCPYRLKVFFTAVVDDPRKIERAAHEALEAYRLNGEWFDVTPEFAIETVKRLIA